MSTHQSQTFFPAGDHFWFALDCSENRNSSYGKGDDARIVIRLSRYKRDLPLKSLDRNPLTIYKTGFVTVIGKPGSFSWLEGDARHEGRLRK
jgi:hypothetical protein